MNYQNFVRSAVQTAFFIFVLTAFFIFEAGAATFTVSKIADTNDGLCDSDCSLREALAAANTAATDDVINFDQSLFSSPQTITLSGSQLSIASNGTLTIEGTGMDMLTISGNDLSRVFHIEPNANAGLLSMTISDGNGTGGTFNGGGGIFSQGTAFLLHVNVAHNRVTNSDVNEFVGGGGIENRGNMTIVGSRIEFNETIRMGDVTSVGGGGILNGTLAELVIENSSVTENTAQGNGGGINNNTDATLSIRNSTVSGNAATITGSGIGGGILNFATTYAEHLTLAFNTAAVYGGGVVTTETSLFESRNSIYAGNLFGALPRDFRGTITSGGFNLIQSTEQTVIAGDTGGNILNQSPQLRPLGFNNFPVAKSHALAPTSPAIDSGLAFRVPVDQRVLGRPFDQPFIPNAAGSDGSDIGALEMQTADLSRAPFDFDGDGRTDVGIFRPAPGEWWYRRSTDEQVFATQFGLSSDQPVPADFTGDGKTDIAFFRPTSGEWFVLRSEDSSFFAFPFGTSGDIPAPGDYDGDGRTDAAVFRPSNSTWFLQQSSNGFEALPFGTTGDIPIPNVYVR